VEKNTTTSLRLFMPKNQRSESNSLEKIMIKTFECHNCGEDMKIEILSQNLDEVFIGNGYLNQKKCKSCGESHNVKMTGVFCLASEQEEIDSSPFCEVCKETDCEVSSDGNCNMTRLYLKAKKEEIKVVSNE
jgi:hypothetical protein